MAEIKSIRTNLIKEGSLIKVYGSKTFLNVAQAYAIDKVRFSVVDIGAQGQNPIDIYLDVEEVRQLVSEIDSGIAAKKIAADSGNYPTAYQWVKGENGSKKLVIGGGQKGIRVQASNTELKINKFAVIQHKDLKELAFMFKLTTGLIPIQSGSYYERLFNDFTENISKYAGKYNEAEDGAAHVVEEAPKSVAEVPEEPPVHVMGEELQEYKCRTNGMIIAKGGYKGVPVVVEDTGEETIVAFSDGDVAKLNWFGVFESKIANGETLHFKIRATRSGKNLRFHEIIKSITPD